MDKRLGEDKARTADSSWYSIPNNIVLSNKTKRKKKKEWHLQFRSLFSRESTMHTQVLFPRCWLDITCWWEVENRSFCFPLLPCAAFPFSLLNHLHLSPWVLLHPLLFPWALLRRPVKEQLDGTWRHSRSSHHYFIQLFPASFSPWEHYMKELKGHSPITAQLQPTYSFICVFIGVLPFPSIKQLIICILCLTPKQTAEKVSKSLEAGIYSITG